MQKYLSPKYGKIIYLMYAIFCLYIFLNFSQDKVIVVMGFTQRNSCIDKCIWNDKIGKKLSLN